MSISSKVGRVSLLGAALLALAALAAASGRHAYSGRYDERAALTLAHYGGGACRYGNGHACAPRQQERAKTQTGPYHSYAVRPAVYGGKGLYTYKGYARTPHSARPAAPLYRQTARAASHCSGHNCDRESQQLAAYSLRPVRALALSPQTTVGGYRQQTRGRGAAATRQQYGSNGGAVNYGHAHLRHQNPAGGYRRPQRQQQQQHHYRNQQRQHYRNQHQQPRQRHQQRRRPAAAQAAY